MDEKRYKVGYTSGVFDLFHVGHLNILRKDIIERVIKEVVPESLLDENTKYYINPTGRFVIGGPLGDTGLTRKKNNCRYIWWICKTWRRSLFRKRCNKSR